MCSSQTTARTCLQGIHSMRIVLRLRMGCHETGINSLKGERVQLDWDASGGDG